MRRCNAIDAGYADANPHYSDKDLIVSRSINFKLLAETARKPARGESRGSRRKLKAYQERRARQEARAAGTHPDRAGGKLLRQIARNWLLSRFDEVLEPPTRGFIATDLSQTVVSYAVNSTTTRASLLLSLGRCGNLTRYAPRRWFCNALWTSSTQIQVPYRNKARPN